MKDANWVPKDLKEVAEFFDSYAIAPHEWFTQCCAVNDGVYMMISENIMSRIPQRELPNCVRLFRGGGCSFYGSDDLYKEVKGLERTMKKEHPLLKLRAEAYIYTVTEADIRSEIAKEVCKSVKKLIQETIKQELERRKKQMIDNVAEKKKELDKVIREGSWKKK